MLWANIHGCEQVPHCWTGAGTQVTGWVNEKGNRKKRALDLFSGTQSVADAMQYIGYEVTTVDSDGSTQPDICEDVLNWVSMFFDQAHLTSYLHVCHARSTVGHCRPGAGICFRQT